MRSPHHRGDATAVATHYRDDVDRTLGADLRFAALLQHVLRVPLGARAAIRVASLTPWTRRNFARWMWEDYPRALLLTPQRWHRGALSASGAYPDAPLPDAPLPDAPLPDALV